jgi:hypothetical protein
MGRGWAQHDDIWTLSLHNGPGRREIHLKSCDEVQGAISISSGFLSVIQAAALLRKGLFQLAALNAAEDVIWLASERICRNADYREICLAWSNGVM